MTIKLNLIAAACENMGIGINGSLPWRLKNEMAYFNRMTTTTTDPAKRNAIIVGRKTWESIPAKHRPLPRRLNVVLTSSEIEVPTGVHVCSSLETATHLLEKLQELGEIEDVWVAGGHGVYKAALESPLGHRLYLTRIKKDFKCDTFFPEIPSRFQLTTDPRVPEGVQTEGKIEYEFLVYEASRDV